MMPFVTTEQLAAYFHGSYGDLTGDLLAELAIGSACDTLRSMCGQVFDAVADDVVTIPSAGTEALLLPELPAVGVSSVKLDGVEVSADAYYVDLHDGILYRTDGRRWTRGQGAYEVTYSHGYTSPAESGSGEDVFSDVPLDLVGLALTMAARIYDQGLVSQESTGGYQVIYSAPEALGLSKREMDVVKKHSPGRRGVS
jgi:hypothetical protein